MNLNLLHKESSLFIIYLCQLLFLALIEITEGSWIWPTVAENRRAVRQANQKCTEDQFKCKNGVCIPSYNICDGTNDCTDGSDEIAATCNSTITPHSPDSCMVPRNTHDKKFKIVCEPGSSEKHCKAKAGMYVPPATNIRFECNSDYAMPPGSTDLGSNQAWCIGGIWIPPVKNCSMCGIQSSQVSTLISDGKEEQFGDSPWHIAIYRKASKELICGGTIVTEFIIISAAHCFYDWATDTINPVENYEIMVSKYTRNYSQNDNRFTKVYQLKEIYLPDGGYHDQKDSFIHDIVILETKEKIVFSPFVAPACVEWTRSQKFNPPEGTVGKVVGWGATGNSSTSEVLLAADLPYSNPVSCRDKFVSSYRRYITNDKFCAGSFTGAAIRKGVSGSGWILPDSYNLYNLFGVVSNNLGGSNSVSSFTDIVSYLDWINKVKSSIEKQKLEEQTKIGMKTR